MSKCRYNLSENCNNTDCLNCVLDKIKAEIEEKQKFAFITDEEYEGLRTTIEIIDKYRK